MNSQISTQFEEIHRNLAILPLHWESRALGPQCAGGRQRVKTTIGRVGWRLNLYKRSSFDEIIRKPSKLGNIATTLGIKGPESSASRWETKGWFWHCRCQMTIKFVHSRVWLNWKKSIENWQYCHCTGNRGPWVLSEQMGDKGLILAFRCRMTIKSV